MNCLLESFLWL